MSRIESNCFIILFAAAGCLGGCDGADRGAHNETPTTLPATPSAWRTQNQATVVATPIEQADVELERAIAEARATMQQAREKWSAADAETRKRWAVKWAAPIVLESGSTGQAHPASADVEHVWVQPINWTRFRIEGVLTSAPVSELACGKSIGQLVSFSTDELSDWISDFNEPHEGGYTVKVLRERFGTP